MVQTVESLKRRVNEGEDITGKRGRIRLGKAITKQMATQQNYEEWTTEELRRGRRANPPGSSTFKGPDPLILTKECSREFTKRIFAEAEQAMREGIPEAIRMLKLIIEGADTKDADRLKAIEMLLNRTMGRESLHVDVAIDAPWMGVMATSIVAVQTQEVIDVPSIEAGPPS